jgi:malonyl-CoA/methylmalonyl-CoA synthetase
LRPATGWRHRSKIAGALALYAACAQAGMIFLPLNTAYTVDELTYFIENSGARMVVCDEATRAALARSPTACRPRSRR